MSMFQVRVSVLWLVLFGITGCSGKFFFEEIASFVKWDTALPYYANLSAYHEIYKNLPSNYSGTHDPPQPECRMTVPQMIQNLGYQVEIHYVTTADGYILELHRIPYGKIKTVPGMPIYLQHGLACSSADFVNNLANESLGYILADHGYDVWLGNVRGNFYSTNHTNLSTTSEEFWDFSYDEIAQYDLPAIIDYVLNTTQRDQLYYIGHSMGTTEAFALFSSTNDYDNKIKRFLALGPVATLTNLNCAECVTLSPLADELQLIFGLSGIYSIFENYGFIKYFAETVCANPSTNVLCVGILDSLFGKEGSSLNKTRLPIYLTHTPAGTSMQSFVHYGQSYNTKTFRRFNKGFSGNLKRYGSIYPPNYDISKVKVETALIYGSEDALAVAADVKVIASKLPNLINQLEIPGYSHMDLLWDTNSGLPVVNRVLGLLNGTY